MTGKGHHAAAFGAGALLSASLFFSSPFNAFALLVGCALGGKAPDYLEIPYSRGKRLIPHRRITHWPILWALIAVFCALNIPNPAAWFGLGFAAGSLIHISGDAITPMGVPLIHPWKRTPGPRWAKTGGGWYETNWILLVWAISSVVLWMQSINSKGFTA